MKCWFLLWGHYFLVAFSDGRLFIRWGSIYHGTGKQHFSTSLESHVISRTIPGMPLTPPFPHPTHTKSYQFCSDTQLTPNHFTPSPLPLSIQGTTMTKLIKLIKCLLTGLPYYFYIFTIHPSCSNQNNLYKRSWNWDMHLPCLKHFTGTKIESAYMEDKVHPDLDPGCLSQPNSFDLSTPSLSSMLMDCTFFKYA